MKDTRGLGAEAEAEAQVVAILNIFPNKIQIGRIIPEKINIESLKSNSNLLGINSKCQRRHYCLWKWLNGAGISSFPMKDTIEIELSNQQRESLLIYDLCVRKVSSAFHH